MLSGMVTRPVPAALAAAPPPVAEDARARLFQAALRLFAHQGYSRTSTRELAEAAHVNVAAISYYFGDKAGLYRAVFFEPVAAMGDLAKVADAGAGLPQVLRAFYESFLQPLRSGDTAQLCMKLRVREMLEPTGLWAEEVAQIRPLHDMLAAALATELGVAAADVEVQRLAVCLAGLGVHLHVGHDVIAQIAPALNEGDDAMDRWADALVCFGLAMVGAEARRRRPAAAGVPGAVS